MSGEQRAVSDEYPPGSFGAEVQRIETLIETTPLGPFGGFYRRRLRRQLARVRQKHAQRQSEAIQRYFDS